MAGWAGFTGLTGKMGQWPVTSGGNGWGMTLNVRQSRVPWEDSTLDTLLPGWRDGPEAATLNAAYAAGQATLAPACKCRCDV